MPSWAGQPIGAKAPDGRKSRLTEFSIPKVYFADSFHPSNESFGSQPLRDWGGLHEGEYIYLPQNMEEQFIDLGCATYLPQRDEVYGGSIGYDPAAIRALSLRHLDTSDIIVALVRDDYELYLKIGYAA